MMRRKRIWRKLLILLGIAMILYVMHVINNWELYKLEADIKSEFGNVDDIEISGYGPNCDINVYVDDNACDFEDIEPIFIKIMTKIKEAEVYNYIEKRQSQNLNGVLVFLNICFYKKETRDNMVCEFSSRKDFEVWELDGDKSVTYNISDYQ